MNFDNIKVAILIFFSGLMFLIISQNLFPTLISVIESDPTEPFIQNDWPYIKGVLWLTIWITDLLTVIILPTVFMYMGVTDEEQTAPQPGMLPKQ